MSPGNIEYGHPCVYKAPYHFSTQEYTDVRAHKQPLNTANCFVFCCCNFVTCCASCLSARQNTEYVSVTAGGKAALSMYSALIRSVRRRGGPRFFHVNKARLDEDSSHHLFPQHSLTKGLVIQNKQKNITKHNSALCKTKTRFMGRCLDKSAGGILAAGVSAL